MSVAVPEWFDELRCPVCKDALDSTDRGQFVCRAADCGKVFPIVGGMPVLINEDASLFRISDFLDPGGTTTYRSTKLKDLVQRLLPSPSVNMKARENYAQMEDLLLEAVDRPKVLIIGGGLVGVGVEAMIENPGIEFIESDVAIKTRTQLLCDGHDLPFMDDYFDGIIIQAVLEHVVDPYRCVEEIHRTLKIGGLVYAEAPFMFGVHGGRYDFTRFTDLGLRRLFRRFEEINRGATCGTGMALAILYQAFLKSLVRSCGMRNLMSGVGILSSFWLKYFDYFSIDTPASLDAASGLFFMGRKSDAILNDRDLVKQFKGASSVSS